MFFSISRRCRHRPMRTFTFISAIFGQLPCSPAHPPDRGVTKRRRDKRSPRNMYRCWQSAPWLLGRLKILRVVHMRRSATAGYSMPILPDHAGLLCCQMVTIHLPPAYRHSRMPIPPFAYHVVPRVEGFKIHLLVIGSKSDIDSIGHRTLQYVITEPA
jgi:hypothetical protein